MAKRQHTVWPDQVIGTPNGDIAVVSDEAFYAGLMRTAQVMPVAGGQLIAVLDRAPTGVPNESVTVRAIFEWSNHSAARAQPEPHVEVPEVATADVFPEDFEAPRDEDERDESDVEDHVPTAAR